MRIKARRSMLYGGKRYKHGDTFEAKDEHARLLILVGSAEHARDKPAAESAPVERKAPEVKRPAPIVERKTVHVERPAPEPGDSPPPDAPDAPEPAVPEPPATAPLEHDEPAVPDQAPLLPRPRGRPRKDALTVRPAQPTSTSSVRRTYTRRDLKAED